MDDPGWGVTEFMDDTLVGRGMENMREEQEKK